MYNVIKQYKYKGEVYNIFRAAYGYYQTYAGGRFITADTLGRLYQMIKEVVE